MKRKPDPLLKTQPWRILGVFSPLERVLHRLEVDGTVETDGRHVVFREDGRGGWFDIVSALRGVIEFHQIATARYGHPADVDALEKFTNKLHAGSPIFEDDLVAVRASIASCKSQAMRLRVSQAADILKTVQVGAELDRIGRKAA
ncbi:MAG: hypothetical protein HYU78_09615 [Rhodocyclales bacterium]|nr:hypothetical protein [Rhodocyclales bacterium]